MRYYTVNLYNVKYSDYYDGQKFYIEEIIVKKGLRYATELLTGKKIEILPKGSYDKFGVLDERHRDEVQYEETGYHLVVLEEDFIPKNLTTVEDIDSYIEEYEDSEYKKIYESIKEKTSPSVVKPQTLTQKVKSVRNTKK